MLSFLLLESSLVFYVFVFCFQLIRFLSSIFSVFVFTFHPQHLLSFFLIALFPYSAREVLSRLKPPKFVRITDNKFGRMLRLFILQLVCVSIKTLCFNYSLSDL